MLKTSIYSVSYLEHARKAAVKGVKKSKSKGFLQYANGLLMMFWLIKQIVIDYSPKVKVLSLGEVSPNLEVLHSLEKE